MNNIVDMSKVLKLQKELKAPKSAINTFGNFNYRNLESILEAAKPLLFKHGLILHISDDLVMVGDRYYIKATARLLDTDSGDTYISSCGWARESLNKKGFDESQITGSASSYARKIAVGSLLLIDDTKDADDLNKSEDYTQPEDKQPLTPEQSAALSDRLRYTNTDIKNLQKAMKVDAINQSNYDLATYKLNEKAELQVALGEVDGTAAVIIEALAVGSDSTVLEAWNELTEEEQNTIWTAKTKGGFFTQEEKIEIRRITAQQNKGEKT